jgi:arylsulfatase A-like enzyme
MLRPDVNMALFFTDYSLALAGLRDGSWKYVLEVGAERSELYDMQNDPAERTNLSDSHPERVALYRAHVQSWIASEKALIRARSAGN